MAVRDNLGRYTFRGKQTEQDILAVAEDILRARLERLGALTSPDQSAAFLRLRLGALEHEEFHAVWLDTRHRILAVEFLARGTIDGASVHPREVVKSALRQNASAVVFAHNHPSGSPEPSAADRAITTRLRDALDLVGVRVLDHVVVAAEGSVSLAQRGWL
ncbi:MAG: DNA repair protein RadC [Dokdonella sp.]|uniref:JAB domain-containing protein n=1 Tax=Dokdonella sp. TaxID=2291710 RepID=UPI0025BA6351|nr:DNA repair protein RadC [Dokdonella sp.]MBZ0224307.1 DNA repair protein RadC [Dokdonella sp.]